MKKLLMLFVLVLLLTSALPMAYSMTNIYVAKSTAIKTTQSYNPINYPIALDISTIQDGRIKFISFRNIVNDILMVLNRWA